MKKNANPGKVITELCFQLVVWTTAKVEKFARVHKFTIGDRIHSLTIDLMLRAVEATYSRDRAAILHQFQIDLEKLRFLFRLAAETRLVNADAYQHAARLIDEIGRSAGGWQKAHNAQTA